MVYLLIGLTLLFSNELEVEGSLKVTGGIDAQGQSVSNVGNPVLESDATNLSTVRSMLSMKPARIYRLELPPQVVTSEIVVPENKLWMISPGSMDSNINIYLSGTFKGYIAESDGGTTTFLGFAGDQISFYAYDRLVVNIFEYPISASGTEQGMNYIVP